MKTQDYTCIMNANVSAKKAMTDISNVAGWWKKNTEGKSENLNDVFTVHFGEPFVTFKISELIQDTKVVWTVTDCYLPWLKDKKEWNNTNVVFEISEENNSTTVNFTHVGLNPEVECYNDCVKGWDQYLKGSLLKLMTDNKGNAD